MLHYFTHLVKILQKQLIFHCKYGHAFISFKIAVMKYEYISKAVIKWKSPSSVISH